MDAAETAGIVHTTGSPYCGIRPTIGECLVCSASFSLMTAGCRMSTMHVERKCVEKPTTVTPPHIKVHHVRIDGDDLRAADCNLFLGVGRF